MRQKLTPLDLARLALASERAEHARLRWEVLERERASLAAEIKRRYRFKETDHVDPETGAITRRQEG